MKDNSVVRKRSQCSITKIKQICYQYQPLPGNQVDGREAAAMQVAAPTDPPHSKAVFYYAPVIINV